MNGLQRLFPDSLTRRAFVARMTSAGLGTAALAYLAQRATASTVENGLVVADPNELPGIPGPTRDVAVLNYALTLEILEADLYRQALNHATGRPLDAPLESNASAYQLKVGHGGLNTWASEAGFAYLVNFAAAEAAHRDYLRAAVQANHGTPVSPNPKGYRFPDGPGDSLEQILKNLLLVEEVGVRAYLGASTLVDNFTLLTAAASIYSTEASHTGAIRVALGQTPGPVKLPQDQQAFPAQFSEGELEYYRDPKQILQDVKPYLIP